MYHVDPIKSFIKSILQKLLYIPNAITSDSTQKAKQARWVVTETKQGQEIIYKENDTMKARCKRKAISSSWQDAQRESSFL